MACGPTDRIWYVAYGSNLCRDRLLAYLDGVVAPAPTTAGAGVGADAAVGGAARHGLRHARYGAHRGCADPTPPTEDRWWEVAHRVRFRGRSRRWGGGVAFLDLRPEPDVATEVRAWSLTADQVLGLAAQEARLGAPPGPAVLRGLAAPGATVALGGGWYDTLLRLPDLEGRPAVTVTTARDLPPADPTPAYLATIAAGRAERRTGPGGEGRASRVAGARR